MDISIPLDPTDNSTRFTLEGCFNRASTKKQHTHDCHQLLRIRSGTSLLEEATWQQPLFSNMTAFIPRGIPHRSLVLGGPVQYKSIYLDKDLWPVSGNSIRIFNMSPLGTALFDRIALDRAHEKDRDFHLKCLDLLLTLLDREMTCLSDITRIPVPRDKASLKLTAFIKNHYREKLTLEDFSRALHYSPRHLSRRFKADLRLSIFEYLRLYRIFRAAVLLSTSGEPVTRIAFSVGYETLSSFYKDFKGLFAVSPAVFRKRRAAIDLPGGDTVLFEQGVEPGPGEP